MSLFDVFKYPISWPPKKEELYSLPAEILGKWMNVMGWPNNATIEEVVEYLCYFTTLGTGDTSAVITLRKLIREYDGDHIR